MIFQGGKHEETKKDQSLKGSFEKKKCEALLEEIERRKKVSNLMNNVGDGLGNM
jgi:hypothetical protein